MSGLLLWIGLTLVVGLPPVLSALRLGNVAPASEVVGGVMMVVGCIFILLGN